MGCQGAEGKWRGQAALPRRALEGSELDPWEVLISEQSPQALRLKSRLRRPWCWTLQEAEWSELGSTQGKGGLALSTGIAESGQGPQPLTAGQGQWTAQSHGTEMASTEPHAHVKGLSNSPASLWLSERKGTSQEEERNRTLTGRREDSHRERRTHRKRKDPQKEGGLS